MSRNRLSESYGASMYHKDRLRTYKGVLQSSQADANVDTEFMAKNSKKSISKTIHW